MEQQMADAARMQELAEQVQKMLVGKSVDQLLDAMALFSARIVHESTDKISEITQIGQELPDELRDKFWFKFGQCLRREANDRRN